MDIPFGDYKIQTNRGSAGHHGVEYIIEHLRTKNFARVHIGILPTKHFDERIKTARASDHVLKRFSKIEQNELQRIFQNIFEKLTSSLSQPAPRADAG